MPTPGPRGAPVGAKGGLDEFFRIARYAMVGGASTLVYLIALFIAVEAFHATPLWAAITGQAASTVVSYLGHLLFTFQLEPDHDRYLPRFAVSVLMSFVLNIAIMQTVTVWWQAPYQVAAVLIAIVIPAANYLLGRFWVFQRRKQSPSA